MPCRAGWVGFVPLQPVHCVVVRRVVVVVVWGGQLPVVNMLPAMHTFMVVGCVGFGPIREVCMCEEPGGLRKNQRETAAAPAATAALRFGCSAELR